MDARIGKPPETPPPSPLGVSAPPTRQRYTLSPVNRRRWANFKANKRGYVSFWVFLVLFVLIHVVMVFLAGFRRRVGAMITDRLAGPLERT